MSGNTACVLDHLPNFEDSMPVGISKDELRSTISASADGTLLSSFIGTNEDKVSADMKVDARRADLKIVISKVAMHLPDAFRQSLFNQIDDLYDPDSYEEGEDAPIGKTSFTTFLRFMIFNKVATPPILGVSEEGHLLGAWKHENKKYFIEFLARDMVRLSVVIHHEGSEPTAISSSGTSKNIVSDLIPDTLVTLWQESA